MDNKVISFFSFLLSMLLYIALLAWLVYYFVDLTRFERIAIKGEAVEVMIDMPKEKKVIPVKKSKPIVVKKAKKSGSSSPKTSPSQPKIDELFSSLNAKKFTKKKVTLKKPSSKPSRLKAKRTSAKDIVKKLENIKVEPLQESKKSIKSVSGKEDKYLQKIYAMLYENWIPSKLSAGGVALVKITIDRSGNFSYKVLRWSTNEIFNEELQNYLKFLKTLTFPKPSKSRTIKVRFEAKE